MVLSPGWRTPPLWSWVILACLVMMACRAGSLAGETYKRQIRLVAALVTVTIAVIGAGCGGGGVSSSPQSYKINVIGTANGVSRTLGLMVSLKK
jgi:hypothetical protein